MPGRIVILDTNLMVLPVVGSASRSYIARHKRLDAYNGNDFDTLLGLLATSSRIVVTPNTVTETSNLAGYIAEPARTHIYAFLRTLLRAPTIEEIYIESTHAADHVAFTRLGIADAALLKSISENATLLTADLDLYLETSRQGQTAINFNHLIEANRP